MTTKQAKLLQRSENIELNRFCFSIIKEKKSISAFSARLESDTMVSRSSAADVNRLFVLLLFNL